MKKFGFTLIEILVAVLIIAVIAVIIAPKLTSIIPNTDKIKILRHHAMLEQAITEILSTEGVYYSVDLDLDGEPDCEGLECTQTPLVAPYNSQTFSGNDKFKNLISFKLGLNGDKYTDGSLWEFDENTITISPNGVASCTYSRPSCENPGSFLFIVDKWGNLSGGDVLTRIYLETPEKTNNKAEDLARAKSLSTEKITQPIPRP